MLAAAGPSRLAGPSGVAAPAWMSGLRKLPRRHLLMLALAVEVLWFGIRNADRYYPPPAVTVDPPSVVGHIIT